MTGSHSSGSGGAPVWRTVGAVVVTVLLWQLLGALISVAFSLLGSTPGSIFGISGWILGAGAPLVAARWACDRLLAGYSRRVVFVALMAALAATIAYAASRGPFNGIIGAIQVLATMGVGQWLFWSTKSIDDTPPRAAPSPSSRPQETRVPD